MFMVLLALCNGILIALARTLNGMLSVNKGPFNASVVNHSIGFAFLTVVIYLFFDFPSVVGGNATLSMYLGGVIGALYVAINSFVLHKIGAIHAVLMVLGGQMIMSLILDGVQIMSVTFGLQLLGLAMIILGMYFSVNKSTN